MEHDMAYVSQITSQLIFPPSTQTPKLVLTQGIAILCVPVDKLNRAQESDNYISIDGWGVLKFHATEQS